MNARAAVAIQVHNTLGEGITWCDREQVLYWTDIHAATLWRYRPHDGALHQWSLPERLASFALCEADGWLLLGLASRLAFFHPSTQALVPVMDVEADLPTRLNDGVCDRQGRFVFGTLHEPATGPKQPVGGFHRLNHDLTLEHLPLPGVAISNSVAFSPDGGTMYFCDSLTRAIQCCDYGDHVDNIRTFVTLDDRRGEPDGSCVDRDGGLWNAQWGLGRVVRYTPDGQIDRIIDVPASQPTKPAFGGTDFSTLYITSARDGLGDGALASQPYAGALFFAEPGFRGLREPRFAGPPPHIIAAA
ncbi:SMP-30/gluconolactonase/LRE family protein [Dyella sp. C11]|uniref:SMP-30/gluconolactonase/LRE family protein n=1 Tax=Dyella sp. C11 TaxID=2126991 RepID=UPI000D64B229|nr:SMP-30/gluconolactonase/LRE family protein [Dyella sp. C11]